MMNGKVGAFCLVLHSHLPLVIKHDRMDEEWLMEATAETYIPLLNVIGKLAKQGYSPRITIGISPILAEQLIHPHFQWAFKEYCKMKMEYARKDEQDFHSTSPHLSYLAKMWQDFYTKTLGIFEKKYEENLVQAFRKFQDAGHVEIITCAATHAYLPLLSEDTSIQAQIKMAVKSYR